MQNRIYKTTEESGFAANPAGGYETITADLAVMRNQTDIPFQLDSLVDSNPQHDQSLLPFNLDSLLLPTGSHQQSHQRGLGSPRIFPAKNECKFSTSETKIGTYDYQTLQTETTSLNQVPISHELVTMAPDLKFGVQAPNQSIEVSQKFEPIGSKSEASKSIEKASEHATEITRKSEPIESQAEVSRIVEQDPKPTPLPQTKPHGQRKGQKRTHDTGRVSNSEKELLKAIFLQYNFRSRKELDVILGQQLLDEVCKNVKIPPDSRNKEDRLEILELKLRRIEEFKLIMKYETAIKKRDKKWIDKAMDSEKRLLQMYDKKVQLDDLQEQQMQEIRNNIWSQIWMFNRDPDEYQYQPHLFKRV